MYLWCSEWAFWEQPEGFGAWVFQLYLHKVCERCKWMDTHLMKWKSIGWMLSSNMGWSLIYDDIDQIIWTEFYGWMWPIRGGEDGAARNHNILRWQQLLQLVDLEVKEPDEQCLNLAASQSSTAFRSDGIIPCYRTSIQYSSSVDSSR
jgi:hypothetical protein